MKTIITLIVLLLMVATSEAQLRNTKWRGILNMPAETTVVLDFKKDSVNMVIVENDLIGEVMGYNVKDSIITLIKISGNSPCSATDICKVKYLIRDDKLFISNLSDPCDARISAWTNEPFVRVKE